MSSPASPRIVVITRDDIEHRYVANRIAESFAVLAVVVDEGAPQSRRDRARQLWRRYSPMQLVSRGLMRLAARLSSDKKTRRRELVRILGGESQAFSRTDLVVRVRGINTTEGQRAVASLSPDVLAVYGTGLIGAEVLESASRHALNLHTGMSPEYRGSDCVFWPIANADYQLVGATVHECVAQVDAGEIYARARASLHPEDSYWAIFARCVALGADLYVGVIQAALEGQLEGTPQDVSRGREYRSADKRLVDYLAVQWRFLTGSIREDLMTNGPPDRIRKG